MKIERDILVEMNLWADNPERRPLIVQGARQIGKTTAINEFGRQRYRAVAQFNFDKDTALKTVFKDTKDPKRLLPTLSLISGVDIKPDTLIFFDEIQECPDALAALKYFQEDAPEYPVISAGSLLGVALNHTGMSFPVGKVNFMNMYPVKFREFLRSADSGLYTQIEGINKIEPLPDIICNRLLELYRRYQICGGLPYATSAMLEGAPLNVINDRLQELLDSYSNDFSKHVGSKDINRIHEIWRSLPSQLSRENNKFVLRSVREGARAREYDAALQWLIMAGMVYKVVMTEKPYLPLTFYENPTSFKIYMLDVGLLRRLAHLPAEILLSENEFFTEFKGAVAENIVLCTLTAAGLDCHHYWTLGSNKAEVDFLWQTGMDIVPIEVKSGIRISGKSFAEYDKRYQPSRRIRYSLRNLKIDGNMLNIPLYLADWTVRLMTLSSQNC